MRKRTSFLIYWLFSAIILVTTGGSALAAESTNAPVLDMENLLRGTSYQQLLASHRLNRTGNADKGFVPNTGNYFDKDNPGWGLDIQRAGDLIFAVWFTYLPDGSPFWYIIVGELASKGGMALTGSIQSFTWDGFTASATDVGTMTIAWTDESNADVSWTLNGEDGSASVSFAQFAAGPAVANMTGHYFNFSASGWGYTLLTQGSVTVMTIYWYFNGLPVWAQGVTTVLGYDQLFELLFFNGPGLCPSCLDKAGDKGFTSEFLAEMFVNWAPDDPPVASLFQKFANKGSPLGDFPFQQISLGTTEGFTSAFGDNFEPEYEWYFGAAGTRAAKGVDCITVQLDQGILGFPPALLGTLTTRYMRLDPADGVFPLFTDPACQIPLGLDLFGGDPVPLGLRMTPTGDGGYGAALVAYAPLLQSANKRLLGEFELRLFVGWGPPCPPACTMFSGTTPVGQIFMYGGTAAGLFDDGNFVTYFPFSIVPAPTLEQIIQNPANNAAMIVPLP